MSLMALSKVCIKKLTKFQRFKILLYKAFKRLSVCLADTVNQFSYPIAIQNNRTATTK